jgi:hypothetical protein
VRNGAVNSNRTASVAKDAQWLGQDRRPHSEDVMCVARIPAKLLKGLSFDIADLILIKDRSEAHGLRMIVRLDGRLADGNQL